MQRFLLTAVVAAIALLGVRQTQAQKSGQNSGLPKVDYKIGRISPLGQGLAIPVTNRGFAMSPPTKVTVAIYDAKNRQLLTSKSLRVSAMKPNQTTRTIVVPPRPGQPIMVRAVVDPRNQVQESNERNNMVVSRH